MGSVIWLVGGFANTADVAWAGPPVGDPEAAPGQLLPDLFPDWMSSPAAEARAPGMTAPPVSEVIFPPQSIPLKFSHVLHLTLADAPTCSDCHRAAEGSMSALDNLIPTEQVCRDCHAIERARPDKAVPAGSPPARCDACHVGYDPSAPGLVARVDIPTPYIKFPHRTHVAAGMDCGACHGDFVARGVTLATRSELPKMATCRACHDGRRVAGNCTTCHLAAAGGTVRTVYPNGALVPSGTLRGAAHDLGFRTAHSAAAKTDPDYCKSCHRERFCVDCHSGAVKPFDFHGGNYVALHALDARRASMDCSACHRQQSFCVSCHERAGVTPASRGSEFVSDDPSRRFHPAGWADEGLMGPDHHGFAARRNIRTCVSCHREQFCVDCHSGQPGGMGISPHPPGFALSRSCRSLRARNPRMCLRCHISPDEVRCGG